MSARRLDPKQAQRPVGISGCQVPARSLRAVAAPLRLASGWRKSFAQRGERSAGDSTRSRACFKLQTYQASSFTNRRNDLARTAVDGVREGFAPNARLAGMETRVDQPPAASGGPDRDGIDNLFRAMEPHHSGINKFTGL